MVLTALESATKTKLVGIPYAVYGAPVIIVHILAWSSDFPFIPQARQGSLSISGHLSFLSFFRGGRFGLRAV